MNWVECQAHQKVMQDFFFSMTELYKLLKFCSALVQKTCNILVLGTIIRVYFDLTLCLESFSHNDSLKEEYLITAPNSSLTELAIIEQERILPLGAKLE